MFVAPAGDAVLDNVSFNGFRARYYEISIHEAVSITATNISAYDSYVAIGEGLAEGIFRLAGDTVTVSNAKFENVMSESYGALVVEASAGINATISDSVFFNNASQWGAGLTVFGPGATIENSTFTNNVVDSDGNQFYGGAVMSQGTLKVIDSTFTANESLSRQRRRCERKRRSNLLTRRRHHQWLHFDLELRHHLRLSCDRRRSDHG